jgi:hypothetical protein
MVKMTIEDRDGEDLAYEVKTKDEMIDVLMRVVEANVGRVTVSTGEFTEKSLSMYNEGIDPLKGAAPLPSFFRFWFGAVGFDESDDYNGP